MFLTKTKITTQMVKNDKHLLGTKAPLRSSDVHSLGNRVARTLWKAVWLILFRTSPRVLHPWRRLLLRLFGAKIGRGVHVYPSCKIWAPWNLRMADRSSLADYVDCYCVAPVTLEKRAVVSMYSFLCTASKDYEVETRPTIARPITVGEGAWVCADVFVGPGVTVGKGAVLGARAVVFKDVEPWTVVSGNPAKFIKKRKLKNHS